MRQMIQRFMGKPYQTSLYAFPFQARPPTPGPYMDRPEQILDFDVEGFCAENAIAYHQVGGGSDEFAGELDRLGGDAFKWSLVNKWPFGVSLHIIDEEIDRGTILHRVRVPVLPKDTLENVWRRSYDLEGQLLGEFERYLDNKKHGWAVGDGHPCSHSKIPKNIDDDIENIFLDNRDEFVRLSSGYDAQSHPADRSG